eukprot:gb/GECH01002634.1/.p1 GENE.gb/GECH01002634.1/~~gb/GECH01002634.1/.p1  ORF type:complete len:227 (+),score=92.07 gb/GECH01002634.1/:1-681(+)
MAFLNRMKRELALLERDPPHGICAYPKDDRIDQLEAKIQGPENTPYEGGTFKVEINIPERYPIDPPNMRFITPIYHPNIDNAGRICLDILNMPPKGAWKPSQNISTALISLRLLISDANPDDGLMGDISEEYKTNRRLFEKKAKENTEKYAKEESKQSYQTDNHQEKSNQENDDNESEESDNNSDSSESEYDSSSSEEDSDEEPNRLALKRNLDNEPPKKRQRTSS